MAIIKIVSSKAGRSLKKIVGYVKNPEKTETHLVSAINCSVEYTSQEMMLTKGIYNKKGGKNYFHVVQSYSEEDVKKNGLKKELAHNIGCELAKRMWADKYEVIVVTHINTDNLHNHIIINSVSFIERENKLHISISDLYKLRNESDKLCLENNLEICHKGVRPKMYNNKTYNIMKYSDQSFVCNISKAVNETMNKAINKDEFMKILLNEYEIMTIWSNERKYITFIDKDGHRVRNKKIDSIFSTETSKEALEIQFEQNCFEKL